MNKTVKDYIKYFVLDDRTGDLYIRSDFIQPEVRDELKRDRIWLLLKIMSFNSTDPDQTEEYLKDIKRFDEGEDDYKKIRSEYNGMRDALLAALIERDGCYCQKCGTTENITIDHIMPVIMGGKNLISNLQLLCRSCNSRKGAKMEDGEWATG